jgi:hypothetical protein
MSAEPFLDIRLEVLEPQFRSSKCHYKPGLKQPLERTAPVSGKLQKKLLLMAPVSETHSAM